MKTQQQFFKFIQVGIINTLFAYSLYSLFLFAGMSYPIALFLSMCFGVLFNFKTTGTLVFKVKGYQPLVKFIGTYLVAYCFNLMLVELIEKRVGNPYISGFLAILPTALLTFTLSKYLVFRNHCETH